MKIEATGFEDYIPEDRPALHATLGSGSGSPESEVHLTYVDAESGQEVTLGWFTAVDLRAIAEWAGA